MSRLFRSPGFAHPEIPLRKAFLAAGEAWRGELGKYPPQRSGVTYVRTGRLRAVAGYRMGVESVGLGGIYYTPPEFTRFIVEHTVQKVATEKLGAVEEKHGIDLKSPGNCLLCLSYTPLFNGLHYKVAATVIEPH